MGTYIVTGTAGFIGNKVAELLLDEGHAVHGVDNVNDAYDVRLKEWRMARLDGREGYTFHRVDICDRPALAGVFDTAGDVDAVINLAARAGVRQSVENPWVYVETNSTGALNLLEECRQRGVGKYMLASTSSLYGQHNEMPYSEDADTNRALSPYAASKKAAEAMAYTYHYLYGIDVSVCRYFTVYGPAGRPDMSLFRFVQWIHEGKPLLVYGDGSQSRDFTYVDDIARGTLLATREMVGYDIFNLGSDTPTPLMDVIRYIEEKSGAEAKLEYTERHPADVLHTWANIDHARNDLGWSPQVSWQQGIDNLIAWYRENRDWASKVETG
ncbi:MAG: NAD-dependent epimerase/dehydratase family protein [Planctomycetota bacterium]